MTKGFFRTALFAGMAILCSTIVVDATTTERIAAIQTAALLA